MRQAKTTAGDLHQNFAGLVLFVDRIDEVVVDGFDRRRVVLLTHEALGAVHGVARVELPLPLGGVADEFIALVVHRIDGRNGVLAAPVGDELYPLVGPLHDGRAGVGRTEVNHDDS